MTSDERQDIWSRTQWEALRDQHVKRISKRLGCYLDKRAQGKKQPVLDFLFEYYRFRPGRLMRWSPGIGVTLRDASVEQDFSGAKGFVQKDEDVSIDPLAISEKRRRGFRWIQGLLIATAARPAFHGCFGLHEWAMVYRSDEVRHDQVPLRMSQDALAEFVESRSVICTHYDAFRFFTPAAKPLNMHQPEADDVVSLEQPGCLHANMDLYRWAFKGYPWIGSELIADAFELACAAREIDMKASPYDLTADGYEPIPIETTQGRARYQEAQKSLADQARPLRARLIAAYGRVIASW